MRGCVLVNSDAFRALFHGLAQQQLLDGGTSASSGSSATDSAPASTASGSSTARSSGEAVGGGSSSEVKDEAAAVVDIVQAATNALWPCLGHAHLRQYAARFGGDDEVARSLLLALGWLGRSKVRALLYKAVLRSVLS